MAMKYKFLAGLLREELAKNGNRGGSKLPTEAELTRRYHMSRQTVRHALRNSFIPLCNVIIPMFMNLLGGSMVVENIFGIPGIGSLTAGSIQTSDYYLTIAVLFFYSLIGLLSMLLVDLSYGIVDPRIRIGGGKVRE